MNGVEIKVSDNCARTLLMSLAGEVKLDLSAKLNDASCGFYRNCRDLYNVLGALLEEMPANQEAGTTDLTEDGMRDLLREFCKEHGGQKPASNEFGVSTQYLSEMTRGKRAVSDHVAGRLGYRKETIYRKVSR